MVSRSKNQKTVDMLGSVAVDAIKLSVPLAKTIPLLGPTIEGCLVALLYILEVKDVRFPISSWSLQFDVRGEGRQDEEGEMSTLG
jgi:hypothetical protein